MRVISAYFDFKLDGPRAAAVLDAYPHDYVLITPASPVRELMERRLDWRLIYSDPDALLFARANSAAARIGGGPIPPPPQLETLPLRDDPPPNAHPPPFPPRPPPLPGTHRPLPRP